MVHQYLVNSQDAESSTAALRVTRNNNSRIGSLFTKIFRSVLNNNLKARMATISIRGVNIFNAAGKTRRFNYNANADKVPIFIVIRTVANNPAQII